MKSRFHVELQAHKALFRQLKDALEHLQPSDLSNKTLELTGDGKWGLVEALTGEQAEALAIQLKPHLKILVEFFDLPDTSIRQIELFAHSAERKEPSSIRAHAKRNEVVA